MPGICAHKKRIEMHKEWKRNNLNMAKNRVKQQLCAISAKILLLLDAPDDCGCIWFSSCNFAIQNVLVVLCNRVDRQWTSYFSTFLNSHSYKDTHTHTNKRATEWNTGRREEDDWYIAKMPTINNVHMLSSAAARVLCFQFIVCLNFHLAKIMIVECRCFPSRYGRT